MVIIDENYRMLSANANTEKLLGKSLNEIKNKKCYEIILGRNTPCESCKVHEVISNKMIMNNMKHEILISGEEK